MLAWFMVVVAGAFEKGFAVLLKQSHGMHPAVAHGQLRQLRWSASGC
jgi:multidrug transporter EmrE-like cation transporter